MQTRPIKLTDVIYNAGSQSFEARVSVYDQDGVRHYACAIAAPITMSFEDAAKGLRKQALRRHAKGGGMFAELRQPSPRPRAGRRSFDPVRWLEDLMNGPRRDAA